jgi:tetratricopeptide (TPR) repeat protein
MSNERRAPTDRVVGPADWLTGHRAALLDEDEQARYALASADGLQYTTADRATKITPTAGHDTYMLITSRRVLIVLGGQPTEPEVEFLYEPLTDCRVDSGLLSTTTVVVETTDESVEMSVEDGDAEETIAFVDRMAAYWRELATRLGDARNSVEKVSSDTGASQYDVMKAQEFISDARDLIESIDDASTEAMETRLRDIEARFETAHTDTHRRRAERSLRRSETLLATARDALEAREHRRACEMYLDAADELERGRDVINGLDGEPDIADRRAVLEDRVREFGEEFLNDGENACKTALETDEPRDAADTWQSALDRYSAAIDAGWDGQAGISAEMLVLQQAWVTASLIESLEVIAERAERRGNECDNDETALERYDEALAALERARDIARGSRTRSATEFQAAIERVTDEKLDRSEWEWGNPDSGE